MVKDTIMEFDAELDVRGLRCPLPVLKLRKRLGSLISGQVIQVLADDPAVVIDIPHFCTEAGHELISHNGNDGLQTFTIRKG